MTSARPRAMFSPARRGTVALGVGAIALSLVGFADPRRRGRLVAQRPVAGRHPALAPVAVDSFGRTVTGGWGTATTGGAWTTVGGVASDYAVAGGSRGHDGPPAPAGTCTPGSPPCAPPTPRSRPALSLDKRPSVARSTSTSWVARSTPRRATGCATSSSPTAASALARQGRRQDHDDALDGHADRSRLHRHRASCRSACRSRAPRPRCRPRSGPSAPPSPPPGCSPPPTAPPPCRSPAASA